MSHRSLTALPVYNEVSHVGGVLDQTLRYSQQVLVVDDGSTDGTTQLLAARNDIHVLTHPRNEGYGAAVRSAFNFALRGGYDVLVTIDCDGQHQPRRIPQFVAACRGADVVSGSRYLKQLPSHTSPPPDRFLINRLVTCEVNQHLGLHLTDAFCGFKAYRVAALEHIQLTETGYAMPLEFWVRVAELRLRIVEIPVPMIYLDLHRSFGGSLDDADTRLAVYRQVLRRSLASAQRLNVPPCSQPDCAICAGIACPKGAP